MTAENDKQTSGDVLHRQNRDTPTKSLDHYACYRGSTKTIAVETAVTGARYLDLDRMNSVDDDRPLEHAGAATVRARMAGDRLSV